MSSQPSSAESPPAGFSTFSGVFRPIVLTILGAMLYLREGWLVGNNGLFGALLVIGVAYAITGTTALSLASIATNVRIPRGGPFAIVAHALGLEAGGAIGVPLYIAQALSSVMYLYAFAEGWSYLFPGYDPRLVAGLGLVGVGAIALASASLAARTQAVMMGVVAAALASALAGTGTTTLHAPTWFGDYPDASLLQSFAIFFPAATGIMVGAGMSGALADPRRALPRGTLMAWASTMLFYVGFAVWYAVVAPPDQLMANKLVMVDTALVGELVLVGLLSSTLTASLSSLVAAPRLLAAMAEYQVVPGSAWLCKTTATGEPRNATLVTLGLAAVGLLPGSLDAIAPMITSAFLVTYLAINLVVFLEQRVGMISFRPTFAAPKWVPSAGALGCVLALVLAGPGDALFQVSGVVLLYLWLTWRQLETPWETVHSGLAMTLAARLALWASTLKHSQRSWKPELLVPVLDADNLQQVAPLTRSMIRIQGSVKFAALTEAPELAEALHAEVGRCRQEGMFSSWHLMPSDSPAEGIRLTMNAMQGTFFAPNLLLVTDRLTEPQLQVLIDHGQRTRIGLALLLTGPDGPCGRGQAINVWLSDRSPDWSLGLRVYNTDLPVLLAYLITRPRQGELRLWTAVRDPASEPAARRFLDDIIEQGRLPHTTAHVSTAPFLEAVSQAPPADLHVFGIASEIDLDRLREVRDATSGSCLFLRDSGQESLLA